MRFLPGFSARFLVTIATDRIEAPHSATPAQMQPAKIDAATVACLTYAAESKQAPHVAVAAFLRRLLADQSWTPEEVNAVADAVTTIVGGLLKPRDDVR
jgi:hypothetical protein